MNIYIGNYIEVLDTFHRNATVDTVISEKRNVDSRITEYCKKNKITLHLTTSSEELHSFLNKFDDIGLCIVASFGFLLKESFINNVDWIVNIHPGSLLTSRGRHPLPFAIKKGLTYMTLTAHLIIDEKIDHGPVVAELNIPIDYAQSYKYNEQKIRTTLPFLSKFIIDQFKNENRIVTGLVDLSESPYNERLTGDELKEMMNIKTLQKYKS